MGKQEIGYLLKSRVGDATVGGSIPNLETSLSADSESKQSAKDLKGRSVRGGMIALISQGLKFTLRTISMMLLARLLSPEDFGLQGMVLAMTGFLSIFRDAGLSAVTVQREVVSEEQISALFWINVAVGVLLAVALIALSPVIALFYNEQRLTLIAVVSAFGFLINGVSVQHLALLQRQMRFGALATIEVLSFAISGGVGVGMALSGFGYWSLVGMALALPIVSAVGSWIAFPWFPGLPKRTTGLGSMLSFGSMLTGNSLVVYLAYNTDNILLGHYWGPTAVGLYGRGFQLMSLATEQLTSAISTVAFPSLSRLQNDPERFERAFLRGYSLVISMTIPVALSCAIFANEIIRVMLGPKWFEVVPIFRLFSPTILAFAFINPLAWFLISSGRIRRSLNMAFLIAPCVIGGVLIGVKFGPKSVAFGFSTMMVLLVVPLILWARSGTTMTGKMVWSSVKNPILAGLVAGLFGVVVYAGLGPRLPMLATLVMGVGTIFVTYCGVLFFPLGQKYIYVDLIKQLRAGVANSKAA